MENYNFLPGQVASPPQGYPLNSFKYLTRSPYYYFSKARRNEFAHVPCKLFYNTTDVSKNQSLIL